MIISASLRGVDIFLVSLLCTVRCSLPSETVPFASSIYDVPFHREQSDRYTFRGSVLANAYHVWSTSVTAIVSYPADRPNDRPNDNVTPPALAEL